MTLDIITLGEVLIDMFPAEIGRPMTDVTAFKPKPGGAPANVAVAAARLGARSGFIGKVGNDIFGRYLQAVLAGEGVETRGMCIDQQARTTLVFIALPDENTTEFVFYRNPGADMLLRADELDVSLLRETRCLHFGSLSLIDEPVRSAAQRAVEIAHSAGALVSFDVNYRPTLWGSREEAVERVTAILPSVDLVKVNETELSLLAGSEDLEAGTQALLRCGPRLCIVTLGARGSFFQTGNASQFVPAFGVQTVDSTGCGDAFIAGLLSRLVRAEACLDSLSAGQLSAALTYANAVGALTAQTLGVIPALPHASQVEEFLKAYELK